MAAAMRRRRANNASGSASECSVSGSICDSISSGMSALTLGKASASASASAARREASPRKSSKDPVRGISFHHNIAPLYFTAAE